MIPPQDLVYEPCIFIITRSLVVLSLVMPPHHVQIIITHIWDAPSSMVPPHHCTYNYNSYLERTVVNGASPIQLSLVSGTHCC